MGKTVCTYLVSEESEERQAEGYEEEHEDSEKLGEGLENVLDHHGVDPDHRKSS